MSAPQTDLFYPLIGRCAGCAHKQCPHPSIKQNNPMANCEHWTDGNPTADPFEVIITPNAYMVESEDVQLNCTLACRRGLPRKRNYPIVFI